MSIEVLAGPLSFTCAAVMFAYVANEAAKLVHDSQEKRKTLYRLSKVSIRLVHANPALVSSAPLPGNPAMSRTDADCSKIIPSRHQAACRALCGTWPVWGASKGSPKRQPVVRLISRGSATISPPAWLRRGSKRPVHGRSSKAGPESQPQSSCGDKRRANKRSNPSPIRIRPTNTASAETPGGGCTIGWPGLQAYALANSGTLAGEHAKPRLRARVRQTGLKTSTPPQA